MKLLSGVIWILKALFTLCYLWNIYIGLSIAGHEYGAIGFVIALLFSPALGFITPVYAMVRYSIYGNLEIMFTILIPWIILDAMYKRLAKKHTEHTVAA